jgi:hypothetical protein
LRRIEYSPELILIPLGIACICGHIWTIFLNFNGGKGIATTLGVLIGFACRINGLTAILGLLVLIRAHAHGFICVYHQRPLSTAFSRSIRPIKDSSANRITSCPVRALPP